MEPVVNNVRSKGGDSGATPPGSPSPSVHEVCVDVFGGYSFECSRSATIAATIGDDEGSSDLGDDEDEGGYVSVPESPISGDVEDRESAPAGAAGQVAVSQSVTHLTAGEGANLVTEPTQPTEQTKGPFTEVPVSSQKNESPSESGKPTVPPRYPTFRRPSKYTSKRRERSGIAALDKRLRDGTNELTGSETVGGQGSAPTDVDRERRGSRRSLFGGIVDRYKLGIFRKSTQNRNRSRTVSEISTPSGAETVPPSHTLSFQNTEILECPPTLFSSRPSLTGKQRTRTHSNSVGWREGDKSGFANKSLEGARGPPQTKGRPRTRGQRSGSVSEGHLSGGHLSEGHQSLEDEVESKKKVDWYDAERTRRGDVNVEDGGTGALPTGHGDTGKVRFADRG